MTAVRRIAIVLLLMPVASSAEPTAEMPRTTVALEYSAPSGCPDSSAFEQALRSRRPQADIVQSSPQWTVHVAIEREGPQHVGHVAFEGGPTSTSVAPRTLRDASCSHLVLALAFVVALSLEHLPAPPPPSPPPPSPPPPPPQARHPLHASLGASFIAHGGLGPNVGLGLGLHFDFDVHIGHFIAGARLGSYDVQSPDVERTRGTVHTELEAMQIEPCAGWAFHRWLDARVCPRVDLGVYRALGRGYAAASSRAAFWESLGLALRADVHPTKPLRFGIAFAFAVPLERHAVVLSAPREVLFEMPAVGPVLELGMGYDFF